MHTALNPINYTVYYIAIFGCDRHISQQHRTGLSMEDLHKTMSWSIHADLATDLEKDKKVLFLSVTNDLWLEMFQHRHTEVYLHAQIQEHEKHATMNKMNV